MRMSRPNDAAGDLVTCTQFKKDLLTCNGGCYNCHEFFADHFSRLCPWRRPTIEAVQNLTVDGGQRAAAAQGRAFRMPDTRPAGTPSIPAPAPAPARAVIAAIFPNSDSDSNSSDADEHLE